MEHPRLIRGAKRLGASHQISGDKPRDLGRRLRWTWQRHLARRHLRSVLAQARFLKSEDLDLAVQSAVKMGYQPKIVLSYRRFDDQAASRLQRQNYASVDWLEDYYLRVCRNALVQIKLYGGCLVAYDELMRRDDTEWAETVAAVTGLSARTLVASRDAVLARPGPVTGRRLAGVALSPHCDDLFDRMHALRNQVFDG